MNDDFFGDGVFDLSTCHLEPIQVPGTVQPHGVMLVLEDAPERRILSASDNCSDLLGLPAQALIGQPLTAALTDAGAAQLEKVAPRPKPGRGRPSPVEGRNGQRFNALVHRSPCRHVIVELEPPGNEIGSMDFLPDAVERVTRHDDLATVYAALAEVVKEHTGFDRVMVYRFDAAWNGQVVGEAREPDMEPFLGLHYPAADIPEQARRLYTISWVRLIADVDADPAPMIGQPDSRPVDMSHAILRSVSRFHIAYLQNMGVGASMSISLLQGGQLWGLISCHHRTPRRVGHGLRVSCELLGEIFSTHVTGLVRRTHESQRARSMERLTRLFSEAVHFGQPWRSLLAQHDLTRALFGAPTFAVFDGLRWHVAGEPVPEEPLTWVASWLARLDEAGHRVRHVRELQREIPELSDWSELMSGALAVLLPNRLALVWFRPEQAREVTWGSAPQKNIRVVGGTPRLSPQGSFALWKETERGRSAPWPEWAPDVGELLRTYLLETRARQSAGLKALNQELQAANLARDNFLAALSHELRTPLNAILGWTDLLNGGRLTDEQRERALEVIDRNAKAQLTLVTDLLDVSRIDRGQLRLEQQPVDIIRIARAAIETVQSAADAREIRVELVAGSVVDRLLGDPARLQQILWNLLSNAIKYTGRGGHVQVRIIQANSNVDVSVIDNGQGIPADFLPHVFSAFKQVRRGGSSRSGLGLGLYLVKTLTEAHGGTVTAESPGEGAGSVFTLSLPLTPVRNYRREQTPSSLEVERPSLSGITVLVVEDDPDSLEMLGLLLDDADAEVLLAGSGPEALRLLDCDAIDVLVSDIEMNPMNGYELVREVHQRCGLEGLPAIAVTAHARPQDRARSFIAGFQLHLSKPIDAAELVSAIASIVDRRRRPAS